MSRAGRYLRIMRVPVPETSMVGTFPLLGEVGLIAIGAILGWMGKWGAYRLENRGRRNRLRDSLKAELESTILIDEHVEHFGEDPDRIDGMKISAVDFIPTHVYESQAADLGLLTRNEQEKIIGYYSFAKIVSAQTELLTRFKEEEGDEPEDYRKMHESMIELKNRKDDALKALESP